MPPPAPPDYPAALFSLARLPGLLQSRGAVLLRRMLPGQLLSQWLPVLEKLYAGADELFESGRMDDWIYQTFYRYGHVDPRSIPDYDLWLRQLLGQPGLRNLLRTLFGPRAWVLLKDSAPRRQAPQLRDRAIFFHQDQEFIGPLPQAVNVWIPLTPAGGDWPGLELWLDGPQAPLLNFAMSPPEREQVYARIPPEARWRPQLMPGDILLFTAWTVHRTCFEPGMQQTRYSYELRLISESEREGTPSPLLEWEL